MDESQGPSVNRSRGLGRQHSRTIRVIGLVTIPAGKKNAASAAAGLGAAAESPIPRRPALAGTTGANLVRRKFFS
jgi:hypothetical protein